VRNETFFAKGQRPIREAVYETRHGPLLNSAQSLNSGWAWPCKPPDFKDDKSLDAFFDLSRAQNQRKSLGRQPRNPGGRAEHAICRRQHISAGK
jgi:acyl-homoserine-lactone acylase